jgi:hypothetical protein
MIFIVFGAVALYLIGIALSPGEFIPGILGIIAESFEGREYLPIAMYITCLVILDFSSGIIYKAEIHKKRNFIKRKANDLVKTVFSIIQFLAIIGILCLGVVVFAVYIPIEIIKVPLDIIDSFIIYLYELEHMLFTIIAMVISIPYIIISASLYWGVPFCSIQYITFKIFMIHNDYIIFKGDGHINRNFIGFLKHKKEKTMEKLFG